MHTITLTNPDSAMIHEGTDPPEDPIIESEVKTEVWAREVTEGSLPEVFSTIEVPRDGHWTRTFLSFVGPGSLVAVGYMDPGNWSTDLAGGATYGYKLLFVILLSSLIAMFLQYLAIKVGFATGRDLAQCCRDYFTSKPLLYMLWFVSELAICACDLAEVIGSAIALNLLFGLPIIAGVCITAADVLLILFLQNKRFEWIERLVLALVSTITVCFIVQLVLSKPDAIGVLKGFVPSAEIFSNKDILYVAIGIIGATVMPHNLFLHSSLVLTRKYHKDSQGMRDAIMYSTWDSCLLLSLALFVNSAILIVAAAVFFVDGYNDIATLEDAYTLLNPLLGAAAPGLFGAALLASGQSSTITGTLAGQIVMEGFVNWRIHPGYRRLATRPLAIIPTVIFVSVFGEKDVNVLLVFSQVLLSYALPFAVFPLVYFSSDPKLMGEYAIRFHTKILAYVIAFGIVAMNLTLLVQQIQPPE